MERGGIVPYPPPPGGLNMNFWLLKTSQVTNISLKNVTWHFDWLAPSPTHVTFGENGKVKTHAIMPRAELKVSANASLMMSEANTFCPAEQRPRISISVSFLTWTSNS